MSERETALKLIDGLRHLARDIGVVRDVAFRRTLQDDDYRQMLHRLGQWRNEVLHAVDLLGQAGADPVPVCQWREIATAPKDGTRILLTPAVWTAKKVVSAYYRLGLWWVESADVRGSMRAFTDPDDDASHWPFTHWMPLPAPPVALVPAEQTNKE